MGQFDNITGQIAYDQRAAELGAAAQRQALANAPQAGGYGYVPRGVSDPESLGYSLAAAERMNRGQGYDPRATGHSYRFGEQQMQNQLGQGFRAFNDTGKGNLDIALQNSGDVRAYQDAVNAREQYATGGWGAMADSNRYYLGGNREWAGNRIGQMDARAAAMQEPGRYQSTLDGLAMYQGAAAGQIAGVGGQIGNVAGQVGGVGGQIGQAANGVGYQGQLNAAGGLYALGQQGQGPSAAEMAMRAQAGQALQGQAAMAAAGRGANAGLAMQNASGANATIQGNLIAQIGQQRAAEDLAYRQQRMQALGAAGGMYGNAMGSQVSALGQQANVYGQQGQLYGQQAGAYGAAGQMAGAAGQTVMGGSQLDLARDEAARAYYGMGTGLATTQLGADTAFDAARTGNYLNDLSIRQTGRDQRAAADKAFGRQLLGGGLMAAGALGAGFTGGASLAAVPAGAAIANG